MSDPKVIYLGPECEDEFCDGRTWADHVAWPDCECKHKPVRYNIGSNYDAALAREAALREERDALQHRLNDAEKLFDAAVTALNEIAKVSRIGEKPFEIATLAIGEMSALKPVEASEIQAHICEGCGAQGWTTNCDKCIPY